MRSYVLEFNRHGGWFSEHKIIVINANSESEALGFALQEIPDSKTSEFTVYGGDVNEEVGVVDYLHSERCEQ